MIVSNIFLAQLAEHQKKLDDFIEKRLHNENETEESLFKKRIIAFLVELGEYANEERAFKFWSQKPPSELSVRLEEYIDGLHFILGLGNAIEFNYLNFELSEETKHINGVIDNYLKIIQNLAAFTTDKNATSFSELLSSYLNIVRIQNYSETDLINVYTQKNQINYDRQNQGY